MHLIYEDEESEAHQLHSPHSKKNYFYIILKLHIPLKQKEVQHCYNIPSWRFINDGGEILSNE